MRTHAISIAFVLTIASAVTPGQQAQTPAGKASGPGTAAGASLQPRCPHRTREIA